VPCERGAGHVGHVGKVQLARVLRLHWLGVVGVCWRFCGLPPDSQPYLTLETRIALKASVMPGSPRSKTGLGPTRDTYPVAVASRQSAGDLHRMVVVAACCLDLLRERRHASASGDHGCATGVPSRPETRFLGRGLSADLSSNGRDSLVRPLS